MFSSQLFDETTFYQAFIKDLVSCQKEVIIESPYITNERMKLFLPILKKLLNKNVRVFVITRNPKEHEIKLEQQSETGIRAFEVVGVQVLICLGNHHRKLAILDRTVLWEGSLNIFSQNHSREIMRRIEGSETVNQMFDFLKLKRFI
ncbi:MAG: phospholipase D-like domain-containing protein [Candidatus Woykebacteria bacterium]